MPVVTVAAPAHAASHELLLTVADAVADALDLAPGDVIALSTPASAVVVNGAGADAAAKPWALISIHGSDRGAEATRRARAAAGAAATDWSRRHAAPGDVDGYLEGVWCEWLLPQHP
ncbi:hypothetical protein [Microbacterium sp. 1.5R]|uniref:hypothetical protein n=1 Tax=Microbacterium sp. 1.5R TaxID=1916917 RepID=UPI0011A986F9|nr:hypothetical protein [Microbacterium sp. 1.5R]